MIRKNQRAMMTSAMGSPIDLLQPDRITTVIDIGAKPIDGNPSYKTMLQQGLCRLIGFEPQAEVLAALDSRKSDLELYLPYTVGDGKDGLLRVCRAPGMTSLLEPDENALQHFPMLSEWGKVVSELPMSTRRLDDIGEIDAIDLLRIDVQGSELSVFQHGQRHLARAVAIQTEVSFVALYKGQPAFDDIDLELRKLDFVPHAFTAINRRMIAPLPANDPCAALNQLVEADVIYVRDFTRPDAMDVEQLKHLALIAHYCYQSHGLAMHCIDQLARRGAVEAAAVDKYLGWLRAGGNWSVTR
jgi:FkbM family methyltransferase